MTSYYLDSAGERHFCLDDFECSQEHNGPIIELTLVLAIVKIFFFLSLIEVPLERI